MEPLIVETALDVRDWDALQRQIRQRFLRTAGKRIQTGTSLLSMVATVVVLIAARHLTGGWTGMASAALGLFVGIGIVTFASRRYMRAWRPTPASAWFSPLRFQLDATGIRAEQKGNVGIVEWSSVLDVEDTADHVFLFTSQYTAFTIPKRALPTVPPAEFVARLRAWHALHAPPTPAQGVANAEVSPGIHTSLPELVRERSFLRDLGRNLLTGTRMFFLARAKRSELTTGFGQVVALLLIAVVTHLSFDISQIKDTSDFYYWGFYTWFTCVVLVIWVSALVTRAIDSRTDSGVMVVATLAMAPWAIVAFWVLSLVPDPSRVVFPVLVALVVLVLGMRAMRVVHGTITVAAFLIMGITATGVGVAIDQQYLYARLWPDYGDYSESEGSSFTDDWRAAESLLFDQPEVIAEAVDALSPERPGVADVFFVGFAGDGSQRVFRREALFAENVFAERMGSAERSLRLINDQSDRIAYPLATATGLRHGLIRMAGRMNVEEDVLVLMLTSHGSAKDGIYVANGSLPLSNLEPEAVLRALDVSGIKWRIVIVSACYSGTFIEPLQNENTVVITAADADSTSFGCADDRDLTYFGEAFLRDALPAAPSLEDAFEQARQAIAEREKAEGLSASSPQIFVGDAIREKLAGLGDLPLQASVSE